MTSLWTQVLSGLCWIVYGSFFEWYWHKFWMHTPRFPREAFRGHTLVHHQLYKGDDSFYLTETNHPEHILLKPYALPAIVAAHLPIMYGIDRFLIHHTLIGGLIATVLYFVIYEYMHWNMHVPRGHFVERYRWFQFLRTHHKLHHRYYQKNFCVLFPLADWCLGTLITEESLARIKAEREQAIENGEALPPQKKRRQRNPMRIRMARFRGPKLKRPALHSKLAVEFMKFKTRRMRQRRKYRKVKVRDLRELLPLGRYKDRR